MSDWRGLAKEGKFAEAEGLMLAETAQETPYGYETLARARFYEEWGDHAQSRDDAKRYYDKSLAGYQLFASWATSGGEGAARMIDVNRLQEKLAGFE